MQLDSERKQRQKAKQTNGFDCRIRFAAERIVWRAMAGELAAANGRIYVLNACPGSHDNDWAARNGRLAAGYTLHAMECKSSFETDPKDQFAKTGALERSDFGTSAS